MRLRPRATYAAALALVVAIGAAALIVIGARQFIGYDSYWHVFIARQDRWPNFWREVRDNAHPPLFYLLLRAAAALFGPTLLSYRIVSIASIVVSTVLVAMVVRRITRSRALAIVAAAAFGWSYGAIMTGLEVRAYALCGAFTLAAFLFYLEWLRRPARRLSAGVYVGFSLATTVALATHYSTFLFLAATVAAPAVLAWCFPGWRRRIVQRIGSRPVATAVMFAVPFAAALIAYVLHVRLWAGRLGHIPEFVFDPARESRVAFLERNTVNLAAILVPGGSEFVSGVYNARQTLALVALALVAAIAVYSRLRARKMRGADVAVIVFALLVVLNAIGGAAGRYPYGGVARHEYFLVPFAIVALFALLDWMRRAAPPKYRSGVAWAGAAACGVAASVLSWTSDFRVEPMALYQPQMNRFRSIVANPDAVLVDQFNFINFFSHYHDWVWRSGGFWDGEPVRQIWTLRKNNAAIVVCRDTQWALDVSNPATYDDVIACAQRTGRRRVAIFRAQWELAEAPWDVSRTASILEERARADGLRPLAVAGNGGNVFADFAVEARCTTAPGAPANLRVASNRGRTVVLAWDARPDPQTSYTLAAGTAEGRSDALIAGVRDAMFSADGVRPGTYFVRVRARNACGVSDPSRELRVVVE